MKHPLEFKTEWVLGCCVAGCEAVARYHVLLEHPGAVAPLPFGLQVCVGCAPDVTPDDVLSICDWPIVRKCFVLLGVPDPRRGLLSVRVEPFGRVHLVELDD